MAYLKHPIHGNRHVPDGEAATLEAAGWTRFPRSKEAKALGAWPPVNAAPQDQQEGGVSPGSGAPAPDGAAPVKRRPGRPRKDAA
jgi:hypothetical protein